VTQIIGAYTTFFYIPTVLFQYYEKHQYHIHGQILKPITQVKPSPGTQLNVKQMISSASKKSSASLTSK
jgi:hypothetical protein